MKAAWEETCKRPNEWKCPGVSRSTQTVLMPRQGRGTRTICSWENRMHSRVKIAAEIAILTVAQKVLLMCFFVCVCVTATLRLHLLFLFPPLPRKSSENQSCCSGTYFSRPFLPPSTPELCCCWRLNTSIVLDGKYSCDALIFSVTTQEQIHCGPTISHFKEGFAKCVDLFGPDEKESYRWKGKWEQ